MACVLFYLRFFENLAKVQFGFDFRCFFSEKLCCRCFYVFFAWIREKVAFWFFGPAISGMFLRIWSKFKLARFLCFSACNGWNVYVQFGIDFVNF